MYVKKDLFKLLNIDPIVALKKVIESGCYVYGTYNEEFIPGKRAYGKKYYLHDFLLIGYDEERFISVGYLADGKFKCFDIPNKNLYDSLKDGVKTDIEFLSYNKGRVPTPNVKRMIRDLNQYIVASDDQQSGKSYGILSHIKLRDFFVNEVVCNNKKYIDERYMRVLYEHKWILMMITQIFLDDGERQDYEECAKNNLVIAERMHMLGLKMAMTGNLKKIEVIVALLDKIIESERQYIPKLINVLKEKYLLENI